MFGLEQLLAPVSVDEFLTTYWGQRSLVIPGKAGRFRDLFGWEDINHLLSYARLGPGAASLVQDKKALPASAFAQIDHWLGQGATLVLNQIQESDPIVDRFASALASDLNTSIGVNCYASWPSRQGFDHHYDRHDVFVVQVAGRKAWTVFEPIRRWPIERERGRVGFVPPETAPYLECSLSEGDVMYLPRGHSHYAVAETPSIHLTIGPAPRTGIDLLAWLTDQLVVDDEVFRRDFPLVRVRALGGDRPDDDLEAHWRTLTDRLQARLADRELFEGFLRASVVATKIRRTYQLPELVTLRDQVTPHTRFVLAPNQKLLVPAPGAPAAGAVMRGHVLNFTNAPEDLLRAFYDRAGDVCIADLQAACPSADADKVRAFVLQLFERGVLELADLDADSDADLDRDTRTDADA